MLDTGTSASKSNPTPPQNLRHLTDDTIAKIDSAIDEVIERTGFGNVILVIDKGRLKWIQPAPSVRIS